MATKNLARKFETSPALAFLSVIEEANGPIRTVAIKKRLTDSGAPKGAVDSRWNTVKKYILDHPNVMRHGTAAYVWSEQPISALEALRRLASYAGKKTCPEWLSKALASVVEMRLAPLAASVAEDIAPLSSRRLADAAVLAKVVAHVEEMAYAGASSDAIAKWCQSQAVENRLREIGRVGESVPFDTALHTAASGYPERGETVLVVRPGYEWLGGSEPVLVQRAVVTRR